MSKPKKECEGKKCENKGACHKAFKKKAEKQGLPAPPANDSCCGPKTDGKQGGCCPK